MNGLSWFAPFLIGASVAVGSASTVDETPATTTVQARAIGYDGIPRNAMRLSSGRGVLRLRVSRSGTVWIGDDDEQRQILSLRVWNDDVVEVDPYANVVKLNKQVVWREGMNDKQRRSIFYLDKHKRPRFSS
jgi:hypothetical protein